MREKLRYALIGCGRIAPNHIAAYLNNAEDLELCAGSKGWIDVCKGWE